MNTRETSPVETALSYSTRDYPAPYTANDLLELGDGRHRFEVWEGALIVSPPPPATHQRCGARLRTVLDAVAPGGAVALTAVGVRMDGDATGFVPDVVSFQMPNTGAELVSPVDMFVAVEITVAGTVQRDRVMKPAAYAAAGIPHYWRIELEPFPEQGGDRLPVILAYERDGDGYHLAHRLPAGRVGRLEAPFELELDPAWLVEDF